MLTATSASAASGVAPFCIAYGGGGEGGGGRPQDSRFYDWQACLQAAASRGNCVQEYRLSRHGLDLTGDTDNRGSDAGTTPALGHSKAGIRFVEKVTSEQ